jgi:hypothetical protein
MSDFHSSLDVRINDTEVELERFKEQPVIILVSTSMFAVMAYPILTQALP